MSQRVYVIKIEYRAITVSYEDSGFLGLYLRIAPLQMTFLNKFNFEDCLNHENGEIEILVLAFEYEFNEKLERFLISLCMAAGYEGYISS